MPGQRALAMMLTIVLSAVVSCGGPAAVGSPNQSDTPSSSTASAPITEVDDRAVAVVTTGCGHASGGIASGVLLNSTLVLTAAHVVAGADQVWVRSAASLPTTRVWPEFSPRTLADDVTATIGVVRIIDRQKDLALVSLESAMSGPLTGPVADGAPLPGVVEIPIVDLSGGEEVQIGGVATPGPISGTVVERTRILADEVRGTARVERLGYRLQAGTNSGDSGAGIWHGERLAGIVFAMSTPGVNTGSGENATPESWGVAGSEIDDLVRSVDLNGEGPTFKCDHEQSELVGSP